MDILAVMAKVQEVIGAVSMVLSGLIVLSMMVPGEQPEKALQSILDFLKKFSKK
jgi:glutaminase